MLDINPTLLGITIVVFVTMIAVLNAWLYKPMLSFMQTRDENLKNDLAKAGNNDSDIALLNAKAQEIIDEAKAEAAALRQKVLEDAKLLAQSKIEAKREELDANYAKFEVALTEEKTALKNSLVSQAPQFNDALKAKFSQI